VRVLSIQSSVAYGHVGNSAAVFPLQRLGHEVVAVDTVHFAHHTGYGAARGPRHSPAEVSALIGGLSSLGVLGSVDAVLSGYLGDVGMAAVVLEAVAGVKAANPTALYCCDPVMGDLGRGFFVADGLSEFFRDVVVPRADVLTPNAFELGFLTELPVSSVPEAVVAARSLAGPRVVLVTSVAPDDDSVSTVAVSGDEAWTVTTPLLPATFAGAGDLTAALFLAHLSAGPEEALRRCVSSVYAVLEATAAAGSRELCLVAAQEAIATPPQLPPQSRAAF
jgi:pyridoxine kinase